MSVYDTNFIYFNFSTDEELINSQHELEKKLYPNVLVQTFPQALTLAFQSQNSLSYDKKISDAILKLGGTIN